MERESDATLVEPFTGPPPGSVLLGKYRIDGKLGAGGAGLVLRAHHLALDEPVAIKILRDDAEADGEMVERFLREAQAVVRLKSEHVTRIRDVGQLDGGAPYMVMELLDGEDLGAVLAAATRVEPTPAIDYVVQACDAIAEAHSIGIVHRDIKPKNLFLATRRDGTKLVKVLDFGISKASTNVRDISLTQTASVLGTPSYMSPEQMRSARDVDARTDLWALGTVLYELIEGRLPFVADSFAELCVAVATEAPRPMLYARREVEDVIIRCLSKDRAERYQSVAELAVALAPFASPELARMYVPRIRRVLAHRELADSSPRLSSAALELPTVRRSRRKGRGKWVALVLVGVAIGMITIVLATHHGGPRTSRPGPIPAPQVAPDPVAPDPAPAPVAPAPVAPPVAPAPVLPAPTTEPPPAPPTDRPPARSPGRPTSHRGPPKSTEPPVLGRRRCDPYKQPGGC